MVLHEHIPFKGELPPIPAILERLREVAQEDIRYDANRRLLICAAEQSACALYPGDEKEYIVSSFAGKATYVVDATLGVLQALGGAVAAPPLPSWASQPWRVAHKHYEAQHASDQNG
jgi:hypothetical protein